MECSTEKTGAGDSGTLAASVRATGADCPGCASQPKVGRAVGESRGGSGWLATRASLTPVSHSSVANRANSLYSEDWNAE